MYEWLKVLHLLALISWMAGLFYLPRLFVYHVGEEVSSKGDATFKIMERRLLKAIMRPAAVVTVLAGLGLMHVTGFGLREPWLLIKLAAVAALLVYHGMLERYVRLFADGFRGRDHRYFRILNEVPTLLLVIIVIAVVVKPFS